MKRFIFGKPWRWAALFTVFALAAAFAAAAFLPSQPAASMFQDVEGSCTSIEVGKLASADGSVMTAHSCDGNYRTWLNIVPHAKHAANATTKVYWGTMHTETSTDLRGKIEKGEIPDVPETYMFMNVCYPCMNEKQLAIGETTINGRGELRNDEGMFVIEELERIVLQRCTTAREAIKLIGELVKKYGYGDSGECITIADPKEIWHFEIFGAGPVEVGAVWAAVRIPDDQVGVSANIPRISTLDLTKPDYYMASDNVFKVAEEMGWWNPKSGEPFKFWKAYSGRKPFSIREFYILSTLAPSLKLTPDMEELPFSVKPEKKVSVQDMFRYYRETYEGTEWDQTKNLTVQGGGGRGRGGSSETGAKSPIANGWMSRELVSLINSLKPGTIESQRTIAISGCSYSQVLQCRDWLPDDIGCVAWFSFDNPGESPRIPIFAGVTQLPKNFEVCGQHQYREDSACWQFRRANRLAMIKWGTTRRYIEDGVRQFEERGLTELPMVEQKYIELAKTDPVKARAYVTKYTNDFARAAMDTWWEMGNNFFTMFARGL